MHQKHDHTFKKIFSHREMVLSLIRGFIQSDWVQYLDFDTLEPYKGSYISDDLRERVDDMIWRIRFQGHWLYLYLLLEFQSSVDHWMSVRLMAYIGLLYQDIIAAEKLSPKDHLPPIVPIVFYTGTPAWQVSQEANALLSPAAPKTLQRYFPSFCYELLDVGHCTLTEEQRNNPDNWVVPIIELEQDADSLPELFNHLERLRQRLAGPKYDSLRRAFMLYLTYSLDLPQRFPDLEPADLDLKEHQNMLRERLQAREDSLLAYTMQQGMQQGMQQIVVKMIEKGADDKFISDVSGYSMAKIKQLKSKHRSH